MAIVSKKLSQFLNRDFSPNFVKSTCFIWLQYCEIHLFEKVVPRSWKNLGKRFNSHNLFSSFAQVFFLFLFLPFIFFYDERVQGVWVFPKYTERLKGFQEYKIKFA